MGDSEKQPLTQQAVHHEQTWVLRHIGLLAILWGYVTLTVVWAAAVTLLQGKFKDAPQYAQYYLLTVGIIVTFFEMTWLLDKMACCVRQGLCCKIWAFILWVDKWRKFILYTALSVPLFLEGIRVLISVISGFCLLVLACLYLVTSFSNMRRVRGEQAELKSATPVVRHEMATQTTGSTNPFEEEEWSEEETPQQRRQREQEQERRRQQRQEEQRRLEEQRRHEEERRQEEQRRLEEERRQEERRQEEQQRQEEQKSTEERQDTDSKEKSEDTTGSDNQ